MTKHVDQFYIEKVLAGDSHTFVVLVDRHKNNVFNICVKILQNREEAEEAAQDTFLKAFNKLKTFKQEAKFSTWLFRIAYNISISRKRKYKAKHLDIDDYVTSTNFGDGWIDRLDLESKEQRETKLKTAIFKLKPEQQLLLQLYYDKGMTVMDVAKITDRSESNIKVSLYRARQKLFKLLTSPK